MNNIFSSSTGLKVHVKCYYYFMSIVICKLFTFQSFFSQIIGPNEIRKKMLLGCPQHVWFLFNLEIEHGLLGQLCFLIGWNFKSFLLKFHICDGHTTWLEYSLHDPVQSYVLFCYKKSKMATNTGQIINIGTCGKIIPSSAWITR